MARKRPRSIGSPRVAAAAAEAGRGASRADRRTRAELLEEIRALSAQLAGAGAPGAGARSDELTTVRVPPEVEPLFLKAQQYVRRYFRDFVHRPDEATISIAGERYVLLRAASMSVEFVELVTSLYQEEGPAEARAVADNLLFDLAHAIGKADARSFHQKMGVDDPIERLSAGPIHFAFSGWAFVDILPESRPSPDDDYCLIFDHPFSFESHSWLAKGRSSQKPVCIMNAGYSSGWCEESFGMPLVSAEIECIAAGGARCRFVMAPPGRIEEHLARVTGGAEVAAHLGRAPAVAVPEFFQRRRMEDELRKANERLEAGVRERTAELERANERLRLEIAERHLAEEQLRLLGSAVESATEGIVILAAGEGSAPPRITFANQGLARMTGRPVGELVGRTLEVLAIVEDEQAVLDALHAHVAEGRAFQAEAAARRRDGAQYALELHVMPADERLASPVHWIGILRDVTERKSQLAALRRQALHDALTDLPNRILLFDRLEQEVLFAGESGRPLGLVFMDLDGFKDVNDTFGHHFGDQLLREVGPRLRAALRPTDTVARLGGDEFAVLLPGIAGADAAAEVATTLLAELKRPFEIEGHHLVVGASLGIVLCPEHGADATTLMRRADVAMYVAKASHHGFEIYSPENDAHSPARLVLLGELQREECLEQFELHFQPEVELVSGRTRRLEALVRWAHPRRGPLLPADFLPLAESGAATRIVTGWVLEKAIRSCRSWREAGHDIGVSVNLSPRSLRDTALPGEIGALLAAVALPARALTLEITEGSLLAESEASLRAVAELLELGVRLSIDDFGTGYSSLTHLKRLPVTEIKIDRTFVRDLVRVGHDETIVRSIIELGHSLGCEIVAEGIEDGETYDRLRALGCDLGQGFLISRPLDEDGLVRWLSEEPGASWGNTPR
jgi:diguanylate cyclase (GGDEF)-like protein/PAS domain S-box-containing protein